VWDFVPEDGAGFGRLLRIRRSNIQILDELGKEVNFTAIGVGKTLEQVRECTLRAAKAVDKSRDGGQTQVSEFSRAEVGPGR